MKNIKSFIISYSLVFTLVTIVSSFGQLVFMDRAYDTNLHILMRAIVVFVGITTIYLERTLKFKNKFINVIVPYILSLSIVLIIVFLSGFIEPVHPNGYRDIILNFSGMYILVLLSSFIYDKFFNKTK